MTLTEVERLLAGRVPLLDECFPQFASRLIRNGATIGGNLGTGSPIGDIPPALLAMETVVVLASAQGDREVPLADYFTGYRATVKRPGELIRAVRGAVQVPVIASGGAAGPQHLREAFEAGADAVLAASIFHDGDLSVAQVKRVLIAQGIPLRPCP